MAILVVLCSPQLETGSILLDVISVEPLLESVRIRKAKRKSMMPRLEK